MSMLAGFLGQIGDIVIYGLIAIIAAIVLVILLKNKNSRIITLYFLAFVIVVSSGFVGARLYKEIKAESYVNGEIERLNKFYMENFSYNTTNLTLYPDLYNTEELNEYKIDLVRVVKFDGQRNNYLVTVNEYEIFNAEFTLGSVKINVQIDFYDTVGKVICSAEMQISILFLSDKTALAISVYGHQEAQFIEQYVLDNGLRIKINKIL